MKTYITTLHFLWLSLLLCSTTFAQRSEQWLRDHVSRNGNYFEGDYTKDVSNPTMELISLTAQWEPYQFERGQVQNIQFYSPNTSPYFIKAEELSTNEFYWFQTQKGKNTQSGRNQFSGWEVDAYLRYMQLDQNSMGLLVRLGRDGEDKYTPAWIYHRQFNREARYYTSQIRLGINIEAGNWELYRGLGKRPSQQVGNRKNIPATSGGYCIPVRVSLKSLSQSAAWYTVAVSVTEEGNMRSHTYNFYFYHPGK